MTQREISSEFDAAKIIVETLSGLERVQQERAIRFASEALGITMTQPIILQRREESQLPAHETSESKGLIDIKQFAEGKAPKNDVQFAAVAAYYYQFESPPQQRRDTIDAELLSEAARLVGRRRPSRFALNNAKNAGYLSSAGHGQFKLSTVGENLVAVTLPGSTTSGGGGRSGRKKREPARGRSAKKKRA
jgi:hypothetical protein